MKNNGASGRNHGAILEHD